MGRIGDAVAAECIEPAPERVRGRVGGVRTREDDDLERGASFVLFVLFALSDDFVRLSLDFVAVVKLGPLVMRIKII
jgi:hypothetical protein